MPYHCVLAVNCLHPIFPLASIFTSKKVLILVIGKRKERIDEKGVKFFFLSRMPSYLFLDSSNWCMVQTFGKKIQSFFCKIRVTVLTHLAKILTVSFFQSSYWHEQNPANA